MIVKWSEDGKRLKQVVPLRWVDKEEERFYYPRNGEIELMVEKNVAPKDDWFHLPYEDLELETKELSLAKQFLDFSTNNEESNVSESEKENRVFAKQKKKGKKRTGNLLTLIRMLHVIKND